MIILKAGVAQSPLGKRKKKNGNQWPFSFTNDISWCSFYIDCTNYYNIYCAWIILFEENEDNDEIQMVESLQFNLDTIRVATSDFSNSNKLGEGRFGTVYQVR